MRNIIFILFLISSLVTQAEEFTVFEKDGYFGIKDETGNVTVPAVYEKLGWSNGSTRVYNGVVGFRRDNLWGLITVRNKPLTGQKFYTIEPLSHNYFKASIKGRFSNHLFHGILDEKGKTIISFNYFTIEPLGANWLVSAFNGKDQEFGVASYENRLIIPTRYSDIKVENELLIGKQPGHKLDIYRSNGALLQLDVDSVRYRKGWTVFRDGYAGFLSNTGEELHPFDYKDFLVSGSETLPISFSEWTVYKNDSLLLKWQCDSITLSENGMLIAYLNGAHHLLLKNSHLLNNHELVLKEVSQDQLIVQNSKSRKWSVLTEDGSKVLSGYDSIHAIGNQYACLSDEGWDLVDQKGKPKNRLPLQKIEIGLSGQFLAKRNDNWGVISEGKSATYKYDSLVTINDTYLVSYLNRWGVMNADEEWIIRSEFNEVISIGNLLVGRRGRGYTVFNYDRALYKTISRPISELGTCILIKSDSAKFGLMDQYGEVIVHPEYDSIRFWSDHFELAKDQNIALITKTGRRILKPTDNYQEVKGFGDGYFAVRKENRWGFVDGNGLLRISNRYDDVRPFNEGLAPVMLRGKWGFINKKEQLKIQPYYDKASPFQNGRVIVQLEDSFGLLDENGKEVLELIWKSIRRLSTGNYIVRDMNDRVGLVDGQGSFIFRPSFDYLEDFGDRVLVSKNASWGVLSYSGQPVFKINNEEIKVIRDFTMVKN